MPRFACYSVCSLCSAKTPSRYGDDADALDPLVSADAIASGWLELPEVREAERRRFPGWLCVKCRKDVALLDEMRGECRAPLFVQGQT